MDSYIVLILDGNSEQGVYIWSGFGKFDLIKAFAKIDSSCKSENYFRKKTFFPVHVRNVF